jgi:hypothetical protein
MERNGIKSFLRTIPAFVSGMERNQRVPQKRIFAVDPERARPAESVERSGTRSVIGLIPSSPLISLPSTSPLSPRPERGGRRTSMARRRPPLSPLDRPEADGAARPRQASNAGGRSSAAAGQIKVERGGGDRGRRGRGGEGRPSVLAARTAGASGAAAGEVKPFH